ncbi:MAG: M23 family metallopeptidase [Gammaproteobacteria bacterium]|nr:M23 family metallopeptidase [Gammaproteobacteria bacterium]
MTVQQNLINPVKNGKIRSGDKWGKGHYGAPRGSRTHNGLDIEAYPKQVIVSPIDGSIVRKTYPYANDMRYTGVLLEGTGRHKGYSIKIFYMNPSSGIIGKIVQAGDDVGEAQDLTIKYPRITNHIHIEIKIGSQYKDPSKLIKSTP